MTDLELEMIRNGWTPITEDRLMRDRAIQAAIRNACARMITGLATRLNALAERIAMDKAARPV